LIKNCNISSVHCFNQGFLFPLSQLYFKQSSATRSKCFCSFTSCRSRTKKGYTRSYVQYRPEKCDPYWKPL